MSRNLPPRPSIEFLRKEAKDLLDDLRRANPEAQLTDAQHQLSRDYGFTSWPKLKAHIDGLSMANPLSGRWIANVARSRRHASNQFRSATISFRIDGNTVLIADEFVDATGTRVRGRNTLEVDGVARVSDNGFEMTSTWIGASGFVTTAKRGDEEYRTEYSVSEDGGTLTISDSSGSSLIVLEREA